MKSEFAERKSLDVSKGPLAGVRVLSLAEQLPGPYATMLLADLGADVILVERPGQGDPSRFDTAFFRSLARNKRSVALDLKSAAGRSMFDRLLATADVLVEGFRPGVMDKLGLGYESLSKQFPRLIYISISGFGQDGPYRDRLGHDLSFQAVSGLMFSQAGQLPQPPEVPFADLAAAMFAVFSISTALFNRERTDAGAFVDVAMGDCLVSWMTPFLSPFMNGGKVFDPQVWPSYGVFSTADGRSISLSIVHEDHFWNTLCALLDISEYAGIAHADRMDRHAELRAVLQNKIAEHDFAYWAEAFDRQNICWSPLNDLAQVAADPHFKSRGMFVAVEDNGVLEQHVIQPLKFSSNSAGGTLRPAPALGQHNEDVFDEIGWNQDGI
jgi:crotonobetainyl-CoA:carnitine CoA-transferase CaiB-like acyl-CoA transferase